MGEAGGFGVEGSSCFLIVSPEGGLLSSYIPGDTNLAVGACVSAVRSTYSPRMPKNPKIVYGGIDCYILALVYSISWYTIVYDGM